MAALFHSYSLVLLLSILRCVWYIFTTIFCHKKCVSFQQVQSYSQNWQKKVYEIWDPFVCVHICWIQHKTKQENSQYYWESLSTWWHKHAGVSRKLGSPFALCVEMSNQKKTGKDVKSYLTIKWILGDSNPSFQGKCLPKGVTFDPGRRPNLTWDTFSFTFPLISTPSQESPLSSQTFRGWGLLYILQGVPRPIFNVTEHCRDTSLVSHYFHLLFPIKDTKNVNFNAVIEI